MIATGSLKHNLPDAADTEHFVSLVNLDGVRVEQIVSQGQATPQDTWYDQAWHELVVVVSGEALVQLEDELSPRRLSVGDWLLLPAHCRHRVVWTPPDQATVWLALHWPTEHTATRNTNHATSDNG